jgi:dihydroxy-acid dehydratase
MSKQPSKAKPRFRSQLWFDNPDDPGATALYFERYLNYGLTRSEIMGGKPIIGIAQTGSDLSPCNRHHIELAKRVRDGIRAAGGIAFEFPMHPIQETGRRPTAALDRNLAYLGLVEVLHGYPIDGVVLTTGCDKTTPASGLRSKTGRASATMCHCWSICSRPVSISARTITAPAVCRPCSTNCTRPIGCTPAP